MEFETRWFGLFYLLCKYRFRKWTDEQTKKYQENKRNQIVNFAIKHSKFFKEYYRDRADFHTLPTLSKQVMMDNLSDYNTLGLDKKSLVDFALEVEKTRDFTRKYKGVTIGMSSGTSGNKGIIITSKHEENYLKAMYAARLVLPKKEKFNIAFILRVSSPAFNYSRFGNKLTYVNQLQPLSGILAELHKINPNVVAAPPSMLKLLADEHLKGNLKIKPKLIYSYAEVLHEDIKKHLENTFNCRLHQIYQGSEGSYAMTCKEGNLHINEDLVYFELLDKDGNPTKPGEPCYKLLVTDLHKRSQPIIRYELNDILTLKKSKCRCGSNFRVIDKIQGRANDLFWGLNGENKHFIYQDYISRAIISASEDIIDFQAIQDDYTRIKIILKLKSDKDKENIVSNISTNIKNVFSKYGCKEPIVKIVFGEPLSNERSNKLIRIICNIKDGE